ncbi:pilus assembly FimT family protein [Bdellovibrio reynosensis]|uniref:Type II secretion system GspH family protein n=1 Tax=Bdellovibrio reynosensis TaxID=2835041 RepID=A0ABY4CBI0_9BACT|nr:type II secretion system protein [Bdellovibrio reynosensis]UOF02333.1 type II secretion system GspH family protein [Bdellovibrio reynosensis]
MRSNRGFTLIEIMIVLAILAALIVVGAPRLLRKEGNIKNVARSFIVLSKEVRNKARLTNSTYRIVINMDPQDEKYWVERASGPQPVDPEAYEKAQEKSEDKDEDAPPPLFQIDKSIGKEKTLPRGLRFGSVETINMKSPMTSGTAYVHFFPEGFVEAAAIQITDGNKLTWTLVFNPLTGQADIIEKAQSLKDIQR